MSEGKNTPPKGVLIAVGVIAALIVFYFILLAVFPDLFSGMQTGSQTPVTPE